MTCTVKNRMNIKRLADDREKDAVGKTIYEHAANLSVPMDNTK
jgi:hypothetical protein